MHLTSRLKRHGSLIGTGQKNLTVRLYFCLRANQRDTYQSTLGDIIHLTAMNQHIVILNKVKDAIMLFEKRSHIYSSRPSVPVVDMYDWFLFKKCKAEALFRLGAEHGTPLLPYGDEWRKHRKFYQESIRKDLVPFYAESHTEKVHLLLGQLLSSPEKLMNHSKWYFTATSDSYAWWSPFL